MSNNTNKADQFMKEGKKIGTKSLFRWKPDYDGAASYYDKAAGIYRNSKQMEKAKEAYLAACDAHAKADNTYLAGRSLESMGSMLKDQKQTNEAAERYQEACTYFQEDGKFDKAAEILVKAAGLLDDVEKAAELYMTALQMFLDHEKYHLIKNNFSSCISFFVRNKLWDKAVEFFEKQTEAFIQMNQEHNVRKCYASIIVCLLARGDWHAADDEFHKYQLEHDFGSSEQGILISRLLSAYANRDNDAIQDLTKGGNLSGLDNAIGRLFKSIRVDPEGEKLVSRHAGITEELGSLNDQEHEYESSKGFNNNTNNNDNDDNTGNANNEPDEGNDVEDLDEIDEDDLT
eukprot:gb/GECH01004716.1/.p1 GENE.gb/GECH01004716.1/~~gb/GECH01004716.1/.p1  ORF type:complete len:345 (+),score=117.78 gb/GECH01004716.1/:1-1035(+)